jgi:hypothetical protein
MVEPADTADLIVRGKEYQVSILDLSASGAMVLFDGLTREGDRVTVRLLDHGEVDGQVRWVREGKVGIYFTRPLTLFAGGARDAR